VEELQRYRPLDHQVLNESSFLITNERTTYFLLHQEQMFLEFPCISFGAKIIIPRETTRECFPAIVSEGEHFLEWLKQPEELYRR
jgi:hypothetical protein